MRTYGPKYALLKTLLFPTLGLAMMCSSMGVAAANNGGFGNYAFSFKSANCSTQGKWTKDAMTATTELMSVVEGLKKSEGCGSLANRLSEYLKSFQSNIESAQKVEDEATQLSEKQREVFATRQYAQHPSLGPISSRAMVGALNEMAALSVGGKISISSDLGGPSAANDASFNNDTSSAISDLGKRAFRVSKTGIQMADKIVGSLTEEETKCLSSANVAGPFFTAMVELTSSLVGSGQDFYGKDISSLINNITVLARNTHFDRIMRDLNNTQFQNSMSCLIDTLAEGYCTTLDAKLLFDEQMRRSKPISWAWVSDKEKKTVQWTEKGSNPSEPSNLPLKDSPFEGYFVLTQHLPVVTAFLERIQRGIPPKNHSDASFQNKIQSNTFGYFLNERNIQADWNEAKTSISRMSDLENRRTAVADALKRLAVRMVGDDEAEGENFITRVTNERKVIFQLMGQPMPEAVKGIGAMQMEPKRWLDSNYVEFIGDPNIAMVTISNNLQNLLEEANRAAVEYYNYWFIADQPGLMIDSLTGMTYDVPEALTGIKNYLTHFAQQSYVEPSIVPAVFETIEKINRILAQYEVLRETGRNLLKTYGQQSAESSRPELTFDKKLSPEERRTILEPAIQQYKDLIEIYYNEFIILKARSSFLINRLTSFVKIDYQKRLRVDGKIFEQNSELLRQIYYATGDLVFERMRLISSANPAEIEPDLNLAQRTYLKALRGLEDLIKDSFIATIAEMKLETEGADTTTAGIFEDSIIRANRDPDANRAARAQAWINDKIYEGLPPSLKPDSKREWDYLTADKAYGFFRMLINPDRYPGILALNPARLLTKKEAPGIQENSNGALGKNLALFCVQALMFRDQAPFIDLCRDIILKSPMIDDAFRKNNPDFPYLNFLDLDRNLVLYSYLRPNFSTVQKDIRPEFPQLFPDFNSFTGTDVEKTAKNFDARVCALRQRNRNNFIMYLTQGQYSNR